MITLTQFEVLPLYAQAAYTWQHGKHLMGRLTKDAVINLFSVGDFFAEVSSDPRLHYIHRVCSSKSAAALDLYLDTVSLHDLMTELSPALPLVKEDTPSFRNRPVPDYPFPTS